MRGMHCGGALADWCSQEHPIERAKGSVGPRGASVSRALASQERVQLEKVPFLPFVRASYATKVGQLKEVRVWLVTPIWRVVDPDGVMP